MAARDKLWHLRPNFLRTPPPLLRTRIFQPRAPRPATLRQRVRKCIAGVNINPCMGNRKIQFSISFQSMKMIPVYKVQRCDEIEDCVSVLHLSQSQCSILIWDLWNISNFAEKLRLKLHLSMDRADRSRWNQEEERWYWATSVVPRSTNSTQSPAIGGCPVPQAGLLVN